MTPKQYSLQCLQRMDRYIDEVINNKVVTGRYERLAVERHLNDLMNGGARGLVFDEVAAAHFFQFFFFIKHSKGQLAGKRIELEGWQCFGFAMIFGWKKPNQEGRLVRRFREGLEKVARKNGKTTKCGGLSLYGLTKDGEGGPEVYSAATKKEQAKQLFDECRQMARQSTELRKRLKIHRNEIVFEDNAGKFAPLSSDANTLDGLNPHFVVIDELHAHKTAELYNVMISAFGAREQSLQISITTEGVIRGSISDQMHEYAIAVLEGTTEDDAFFAMIYSLDPGDDAFDEANWRKANPNLGVSVSIDYLRQQAKKAKELPSAFANFMTKHMNMKVNALESWLDTEKWKACAHDYTLDHMAECTDIYGGLDLASTNDITSLGLIGILPNGHWRTWSISWLPEDRVMARVTKSKVPYDHWAREGYLELTPGNVTDYAWVRAKINEIWSMLPVKAIAFDDWNSTQLVGELLDDGIEMLSMRQGYKSISPAMKELERQYVGGTLQHANNPLLTWAMGNVVATQDPAGNIKADKSKAQEKIDPAVALIMASGCLANAEVEDEIEIFIG